MSILSTLHDAEGRILVSYPDGRLSVNDSDAPEEGSAAKTVVLVGDRGAANAVLLLGMDALHLVESAGAESFWGVRVEGDSRSASIRVGLEGDFLAQKGQGFLACARDVDDAAKFELRSVYVAPEAPLWCIPEHGSFDSRGLAEIFSSGRSEFFPIVAALLPAVAVHEIRTAWASSVPSPRRDVFFPLVKSEVKKRLGSGHKDTSVALADLIDQFGWSFGKNTYGSPRVLEGGRGTLKVGRFCSMADPTIVLGNHAINAASTYPFVDLWRFWPSVIAGMEDHVGKDVEIGNDVWIGVNVTILPGSVIGDGAVIGAGSVVRGSIPPYAICTGNPAVIKRYRFDEDVIERLLKLQWWNWPEARIDRELALMLKTDITEFLDSAEKENAAHGQ